LTFFKNLLRTCKLSLTTINTLPTILINYIILFLDNTLSLLKTYLLNLQNLLQKSLATTLYKTKKSTQVVPSVKHSTNFLSTNHFIENFVRIFYYITQNFTKVNSINALTSFKSSFGEGFIYVRGLFIIFFVDALIVDDEPL
jgi:hypothetical protein